MRLREIHSLDERYRLDAGTVYLSGLQALVRLLLQQGERDRAAGRNTAGFVSGYRGSPLGGLDRELWRAREFLERAPIHFQPGLNEDLAATSLWGSQQVNLFPDARHEGIYGLWYGKGPGVDRSGDVFKHANAAGTSPYGGVLVAAGDDHACKSSTLPQQSEFSFIDAMMPVLNPADVGDLLEVGLKGFALSRYSGCWVALKVVEETADAAQTVDLRTAAEIVRPEFEMPEGGLHIRWPDTPLEQEHRLQRYKLYAARAFARANRMNHIVIDSPRPRIGIVATGKAYLDVLQALDYLGIDRVRAAEIGIRLYKVTMSWPLEADGVREFAEGLEEVLVVEEKRAVIENQIKEQLYHWQASARPVVVGKFDETGDWILPSAGQLTPARIARVLAERLARVYTSPDIEERVRFLAEKEEGLESLAGRAARMPHFCSGCPHNTSTRVPEGSRAIAGIGCHFMAAWMNRDTMTFTQMGGEGATWIGQAPFTATQHVFQNLGDGTYAHSGVLAIRAALAAGVNITYKLLYNDAVAMTGGQRPEGGFGVSQIARQLAAEGVDRIAIASDQPGRYAQSGDLPAGATVHHRKELDRLQRSLREHRGVSVLIYDQTCAAELRRRRRQGTAEDPERRVFINPLVCEGCGDCNTVSNCLSVVPLETELGRKRTINQSACNKDFSCLEGFCPSFVTVQGGTPTAPRLLAEGDNLPPLPAPTVASESPYNVLLAGIGGAGVVTASAVLGMAAHLEGRRVIGLDQTGLAQKFGAVLSHVRIADRQEDLHTVQIPAGEADLLLGIDLTVASGAEAIGRLDPRRTYVVVNTHEELPPAVIFNRDLEFSGGAMLAALGQASRVEGLFAIDASRLSAALTGDSIAANLFLLGSACQQGLLPVSPGALERAIELNGVAVDENKRAFEWGRHAVAHPTLVRELSGDSPRQGHGESSLAGIIEHRESFLTDYQSGSYARRYRDWVERVRAAEVGACPGSTALTEAVARNYFKLLAYKDEYEIARLYVETDFIADTLRNFDGRPKLKFHLSPPWLARTDPLSGRPAKYELGSWVLPVFGLLARLRFLRGTVFDVFAHSAERRAERQLLRRYESLLSKIVNEIDESRLDLALELARLPDGIRGFGPVKKAAIACAQAREAELLGVWSCARTEAVSQHSSAA